MLIKIGAILVNLLLFILCSGQNSIYVNLKKITPQQGVISYNIKKTIQDKKGFVWIATQEGLSRYDSRVFENYTEGSLKQPISGNDIWDIKEDVVNNFVWVAEYNTLDAIDITSGEIRHRVSKEFKDTWIKCLLVDNNKVWIATFTGLFVYDIPSRKVREVHIPLTPHPVKTKINISSLIRDAYNRIWIFSPDVGLIILDSTGQKLLKKMTLADLQFTRQQNFRLSNKLLQIDSGKILLGADEGFRVLHIPDEKIITCNKVPTVFSSGESISAFDFDKAGNLWIATTKKMYQYIWKTEQLQIVEDGTKTEENDFLNSVFDIRIDADNIMWLSTQRGLAFTKIKDNALVAYYRSADLKMKIRHSYFVYPQNQQDLLVCAEDGLYKINSSTKKMVQLAATGMFFYAFKAPDNTIIASSEKQLFYLDGEKLMEIEKKYPELLPISRESINSALFFDDSLIVMGSESLKGVFLWNIERHTLMLINTKTNNKLQSDIVNYVTKTTTGEVAILSDKCISTIIPGSSTVKNYTLKERQESESLTFLFDMVSVDTSYYVSVYGKGFFLLNKQFEIMKRYSEKDGLCNNGTYKIFNVGDSSLYVTTNNGLSIFNIKKETFRNYYQSDGLNSDAFEEACGIMKNGLIYAGGVNGFTVINPAKFITNRVAPRVYFNRVVIETDSGKIDTSDLELQRLYIPSNVLQTTLHLSAINFSNPEHTIFSWRILENNNEWTTIGGQNFIPLIGLSPGTYHLQIKAANEDGVWSDFREVVLIYMPKWYQTWWFNLLVILTIVGIIYALYRYRIAQIKKQHQIRKNIATDLHDDLGSTLNSVKIFTNLAISGVKQEESLQQIKDNLTEATMSLRDMIWVLDDSMDTVYELVTRLKQFAIPVAAASNMEAVIKADSEVNQVTLTKEEKRNLFLVCKEAINNSIKYSGGTRIIADITPAGKKIQIEITDNGRGFDEETVKKGYGLKNMQYRAEQIKYQAILSSQKGTGTRLVIRPA